MIKKGLLLLGMIFALVSVHVTVALCRTAGQVAAEERQVKLQAQPNFRDLGGYHTVDGRKVKRGLIYRSGQLSQLTDDDLLVLKKLGIRTVIDLRGPSEVESRGKDRLPEGVRNVNYPIDVANLPKEENAPSGSISGASDYMVQATRAIMMHYTDVYAALIRELADPANRPLVFHCTAGKDRAGIGAAIILTLLGVPWETVREDYLLSNFYRREENQRELEKMRREIAQKRGIAPEEVDMTPFESMFLVKPEYLEGAREAVIRKYGSVDAYIKQGLGISEEMIKKLRDELLE